MELKMGKIGNVFNRMGSKIGTAIGENYAKQGKSWDEVASMPSSGSGPGKDAMYSSAKTAYDNYMTKNKSAPVSTSSANMIQSPGGYDGGLASTAGKLPDGGGQFAPQAQAQPQSEPSKYVNNGLASMFSSVGKNPQGIGLTAQQRQVQQPMVVGGYKNMWQPNMGADYQVIGGVGNIL